jgi:hypothetical protein
VTARTATGNVAIDLLPADLRSRPSAARAINRFLRAWWLHQILTVLGDARRDQLTDARDRLYMAADALTAEVTE